MPKIIIPSWSDFDNLVKKANHRLIICSPYYSELGLGHLFSNAPPNISIELITRISPSDWANGVSDPEALLSFIEKTRDKKLRIQVIIQQRLHAKIYVADESEALLGSANLSEGGFAQNLEITVLFSKKDVKDVIDLIENRFKDKASSVTKAQLNQWVRRFRSHVEAVRRASEVKQANKLADAQKSLDKMLGFGKKHRRVLIAKPKDLKEFVKWLRKHKELAGAKMLLARHDNTDGQNLTGHFRQSFFAALRFLTDRGDMRKILSEDLIQLRNKDVYQLSEDVSTAWGQHVDDHATDSGDGYDYSILRGIMPPSLGGTRLGGGGGSSTLKRMLPLVARYLDK